MKTHVVKTSPEATLSEVVDLMDIYQVNGLPVVDPGGRLCGMITEHDILRALLPNGQSALPEYDLNKSFFEPALVASAGNALVSDWMTCPAVHVREDAGVYEAALILLTRGLKRLPVIGLDGQVVGTLNRIDVFQALFEGIV